MSKLELPVGAHVFLIRYSTILLARRADTGFGGGSYGVVGGYLEPGESVFEAAIRECREDIGVELLPTALEALGTTHYTSPTVDVVDFFLQATRWTGEPTVTAECDDLRWCLPDALLSNTIPFVRRALDTICLRAYGLTRPAGCEPMFGERRLPCRGEYRTGISWSLGRRAPRAAHPPVCAPR